MDEKDNAQQPASSSPDAQVPASAGPGEAAPTPEASAPAAATPTTEAASAPTPVPETSAPAAAPASEPAATPTAVPVQQSATSPTATMPIPPADGGQVPPTPPIQQPVYGAPAPEAPVAAPGQAQPSPTGALVCGILAIVFCFIPIVGIVLGVVAIVLAGNYFKAGGTLGQGKAGRICGIVGIALSIIMMIVSAVMMFASLAFVNDYATSRTPSTYSSSAYTQSSSTNATEEERAVEDVVAARLQDISDHDATALAEIKSEMESTFEEAMSGAFDADMTMESCGMDPDQIVESMLEGFTYEPSYMMVDGAEEGATAEANFYVTMRDMFEIVSDINDEITARATELRTLDQTSLQLELGKIVTAVIDEADPDEEQLFDVDLTYTNGEWVIDKTTWDDEINFFFGFI